MALCPKCGSNVAPDAHFCAACGSALALTAAPGQPVAMTMQAASIGEAEKPRGNAITWPFYRANWFASLWMVLIGWFPLPLPLTISAGWLIDAAARRARRDTDPLPHARNFLRIYRDGLVIWVMSSLYFIIPLLVFGAIFSAEVALISQQVDEWIATRMTNFGIEMVNTVLTAMSLGQVEQYPLPTFANFLVQEIELYSTVLFAPFVYLCVAVPLFLAGTVRFVITGKISSYFRFFKNFALLIAHFPRFLWAMLLLFALSLITYVPFIGVLLWLTAGIWVTAYFIGDLAARMRDIKAVAA